MATTRTFGARFLRREIERTVAGTLAEFVVREAPAAGSRIGLGVRRDRLIVRMIAAGDDWDVVKTDRGERRLSRGQLLEEASTWLARFDQVEAQHQAHKEQASKLIETSSGRGFWDDPDRAQEVLRRYKALDARIQAERRLLRPVRRMRHEINAAEDSMSLDLGLLVSEVAASYARWLELGVADSPSGVWLVLGPADPLKTNSEFLVDLVAMYRSWLRRKGYTYEVVAEEILNGEMTRLVLEVEGPGSLRLLEMEEGEHRRRGPKRGIDRARVWVVPRSEVRTHDGKVPGGKVSDARRGRGVAVARRTARLDLSAPQRGVTITLHGNSRDTLELLGRDLGGLLASPDGPCEIAREYGISGGAVRDPRTSASVASIKDVLRGELEPLLRGLGGALIRSLLVWVCLLGTPVALAQEPAPTEDAAAAADVAWALAQQETFPAWEARTSAATARIAAPPSLVRCDREDHVRGGVPALGWQAAGPSCGPECPAGRARSRRGRACPRAARADSRAGRRGAHDRVADTPRPDTGRRGCGRRPRTATAGRDAGHARGPSGAGCRPARGPAPGLGGTRQLRRHPRTPMRKPSEPTRRSWRAWTGGCVSWTPRSASWCTERFAVCRHRMPGR